MDARHGQRPRYPLIGNLFQFTAEQPWQNPYEFAQQVYLIMASMNQIGHANNDSVTKFMQDIVGANMGFIFTNAAKKTDDAQTVFAVIRDKIKSVLRGVSDFTKYPDVVDDHGNHLSWYPNPATPKANQGFNVFNLDPFVWFVHVRLGFSDTASPWMTTRPMSALAARPNSSSPSLPPAA